MLKVNDIIRKLINRIREIKLLPLMKRSQINYNLLLKCSYVKTSRFKIHISSDKFQTFHCKNMLSYKEDLRQKVCQVFV